MKTADLDIPNNHQPRRTDKKTLITEFYKPPTPEEILQNKKAEEALEVCRLILEQILSAYLGGEITFQKAIKDANNLATKSKDIPKDFQRQKLLGSFVMALCNKAPTPRDKSSLRNTQTWLNPTVVDLVKMVSEREGLPIARHTKAEKTAYERVAEILKDRGIPANSNRVERIYISNNKKHTNSK